MQPQEKLIYSAAALARMAPQEWRLFLEALADVKEHHRENLVKSPSSEVLINQGRAQMMSTLHERLMNALAEADQLAQKGKRQ